MLLRTVPHVRGRASQGLALPLNACQQRTGSTFGVQARFRREHVKIKGRSTSFVLVGDSGNPITFHFCPTCGSTVYWELKQLPDFVAVAPGTFADQTSPAPKISVYEARAHAWVLPAMAGMERSASDRMT